MQPTIISIRFLLQEAPEKSKVWWERRTVSETDAATDCATSNGAANDTTSNTTANDAATDDEAAYDTTAHDASANDATYLEKRNWWGIHVTGRGRE